MLNEILLIVLSLVLLYFGASWLISGASSMAIRLGISPLIIGLTIVALGTSMPELLVSVKAALQGNGGISVGNVVGSNIFNIGIILGLSAMCYPIVVHAAILRTDIPLMLFSALLFLLFFLDAQISRWEGSIFLLISVAYTYFNVKKAREAKAAVKEEFAVALPIKQAYWLVDVLLIILGLAVLIFGSDLLVQYSINLARRFGISDAVIGLTIVAAGTSMPELATSVVAAIKKQSDIALGNVVGSNIYNILIILGASSLITPLYASGIALSDSLLMLGMSALLVPLVRTGFVLQRREGGLLFAIYLAYMFYLLWFNIVV